MQVAKERMKHPSHHIQLDLEFEVGFPTQPKGLTHDLGSRSIQ